MFCTKCGNQNAEGVKFCVSCGANLTQDATAAEAPQVEMPPSPAVMPPPNVQASGSYVPPQPPYNAPPPPPKGTNPLVFILPIIVVLIVGGVVLALFLLKVGPFSGPSQPSYVDDRDRDRDRDDRDNDRDGDNDRDRDGDRDNDRDRDGNNGDDGRDRDGNNGGDSPQDGGKGGDSPSDDPMPTNPPDQTPPPITSGTDIPRDGGSVRVNGVTEYTFTPRDSGLWQFITSDNTGDPYLELYDASGTRIASNDDGGPGSNSLIRQELTAGQTYTVNARFYSSGTGSYTLTVSHVVSQTGSIPNNGGTMFVSGATEYAFTPRESGMWEFRTSDNVGDPYLELYNSSGTRIAYNDDGGGNGYNSLIQHSLVAGETYIVNARFYSSTGTGSYTLTVTQMVSQTSNIPRNGGTVQVNGQTYFTFTPDTSGLWEMRTSNNTGDPYLELLDSTGTRIAYNDDGGNNGLNSLIQHNLTAGETYTINARFFSSSGTGSYTLSVTMAGGGGGGVSDNSLVGRWSYDSGDYIWYFTYGNLAGGRNGDIEFFSDGSVLEYAWGEPGVYTIISSNSFSVFALEEELNYLFTYSISGNLLTITDHNGDSATFRRR